MVLFSLAASHADTDLETVARLSAGASKVPTSSLLNTAELRGAVALATCNRYELYAEAETESEIPTARAALLADIAAHSQLPESAVTAAFETHVGPEVSAHLFAVSSGLDSAVVGEREIAGQVRRALSQAQQEGTATPALTRLFQSASKTAKEVGAQTALGSRGLSVVSVALDLASELGDGDWQSWAGKNALVFGTGAYAGAAMAKLRERGCTDVAVFSASGRATDFTASRGGSPISTPELPDALARADVLIGVSGSDHQLDATQVAFARGLDPKPLTVIDLALTHDFDPAVADLPWVELVTLESVRLAAPSETIESLEQASHIVTAAAAKFEQTQNARSVDSAIVALRKHTLSVLDSEIERVRAQHGCTAAAEEVEFAMRRMVKSLLHIPTVRARELAAAGQQDAYVAGLEALYGISVETPRPAAPEASPTLPEATEPLDANCPVDHAS
ncbi:MAG: glutamyl-tRNA reductase [Acidobacteria bacterium]|nr:glutamyl-tRNA reductase [Acidobacteriota bacterium]